MNKNLRNGIISFLALNIVTSGILAISEHFKKKEEAEIREEEFKRRTEELTKWEKETDECLKSLEDIIAKKTKEESYRNEKKLVMYLYAVIKQRKTLMKSEQDKLLALVRINKLVDGIDLVNSTDQELLRYLETECKFDIFDGIPMLTSKSKCAVLHSLKELGIESIT